MQVILEAIKFNHDADSATHDAFSIRRNETEAVTPPEWQRGISKNPEDSPAAYARKAVHNQTLTIEAKFSCDRPGGKLWIQAVDGKLNPLKNGSALLLQTNVLGSVRAKQVEFQKKETDYMSFDLKDVTIEQSGVRVDDIVWNWQVSPDGSNWQPLTTTSHRIYTVLDLPGRPWEPNSENSNTQLPWTGVLEKACNWAAGTQDLRSAAFQITKKINELGPVFITYDVENGGGPHFTPDKPPLNRFDCQKFLDLLASPDNVQDHYVNCEDCAAMVCTFANVLGCSFPQSIIKSSVAAQFSLRRHRKIGRGWDEFDQFDYHAIAWAGADQDEVSDACLTLDASDGGPKDPIIPLLASNIPFAGEHGYRDRLVVKGDDCRFLLLLFRQIGGLRVMPSEPDNLEIVRRTLSLLDALRRLSATNKWTQLDARYVPDGMIELYWDLGGEPDNQRVLRLDIQVSTTTEAADENLIHQLGRFELPTVKPKENPGFGERVFASESGFVILFLQKGMVCLLRNVGSGFMPLWEVARFIDNLILSLKAPDTSL
ncbi:MAG: hypothetical protein ACRD9S_18450 [Pyrinomonadaceae bacterium]